jgi:hypothetical protein
MRTAGVKAERLPLPPPAFTFCFQAIWNVLLRGESSFQSTHSTGSLAGDSFGWGYGIKVKAGAARCRCSFLGLLLVYQVGWGGSARFWKYISPVFVGGLVRSGGLGGLTGFPLDADSGGLTVCHHNGAVDTEIARKLRVRVAGYTEV